MPCYSQRLGGSRFHVFSLVIAAMLTLGFMAIPISPAGAYVCGNNILEAGEACDNGVNNSDILPNACRVDCRKAYCGDGVIDRGEECDDGSNSNTLSNTCRSNCTLPRCGDGVVDNGSRTKPDKIFNEQCDDGNKVESDGCLNSCIACVKLHEVGNIEITEDTHICPNQYEMDDYGDYGAIIIKRSGITLDCHGATLKGKGRGVGIMVFRSNDVKIINCKIYGYETAIKGEDSNNVQLSNNHACNNSVVDIDFSTSNGGKGQGNSCKKAGTWNDTGKTGCSRRITLCTPPSVTLPSMVSGQTGKHPSQLGTPSQKPKTVTAPSTRKATSPPPAADMKKDKKESKKPALKASTMKQMSPIYPLKEGEKK